MLHICSFPVQKMKSNGGSNEIALLVPRPCYGAVIAVYTPNNQMHVSSDIPMYAAATHLAAR